MTVQNLLDIGDKWGFAALCLVGVTYGFWRLLWYVIKETIPRDVYQKEKDDESAALVTAVKANTSSIEMLKILVDERIPRKS